jgi:acetyl-CoA C-acetyltransferase
MLARMTALSPDRIPVIAGIGEIADRPEDVLESLEPVALIAEAARRADEEARGLLGEVDSVDIIALVSWRYDDMSAQLNERLGISPKRNFYGSVGGESPVRYIHEAARRIARGESNVGLIVGAEAQYAVNHAKRGGVDLPWTPYAVSAPKMKRAADYVHPLGHKLGVAWPISVYPFYDAATAHAWGQTPAEAQAESALLWSRYSAAAARNPYAWSKTPLTPDDIAAVTRDNRMISWPYVKRMVANPNVNQGAAIIMTSLAKARAAGIPEHQLVFIGAGAHASEPRDWLARDHYRENHAQSAVFEEMLAGAGGDAGRCEALELESWFPVVPKMARRNLGLGEDVEPSVCGGLSFFGGPLNVYMAHAACAMARAIRTGAGMGLLYGQGEFVTKHHALILAREPQAESVLADGGAQAKADARRGLVPPTDETPDGEAAIETFTILHDHDGQPVQGVVIARMTSGARSLARIPAAHAGEIAMLMSQDRYPIGVRGRITTGADGAPLWRTIG